MFFKGSKFSKIVEILGLDKPLVVFDIETTGPNISTDKIIEIAYLKVWANGRAKEEDIFLNPEMPIGQEASIVHGLNYEDLQDKPRFKDKAQELFAIFNDCYYSGFNIINFDLPVLRREFIRVGMDFEYKVGQIIDTKEIFKFLEPKNLSAAYTHYCHKEIEQKPGAMADAEIAAEVLLSQVKKYRDLMAMDFIQKIYQPPEDAYKDSSQKFYWRKGETYLSFSQYKDQPLAKVAETDPDFLAWMLTANFSNEAKSIIRLILKKRQHKQ
ncbi:MAG: 3'-5' exonuclease [Candidatus Falkowbacteria bacterium]|nr:3'-5' exonuclease [Candidatus Falkowbacteria bacterium]